MTPRTWSAALGSLASLAFLSGTARDARADDKATCIDAHETGQQLRLHGHWRDARQRFQSSCPGPIVEDCLRWYGEVQKAMPSVVVAAVGPDGADTVDVALIVDGARVADRLPATALDLDPGEHTLRVERTGWAATEQKVVVREGEKERRVVLRFVPQGSGEQAAPGRGAPTFGIVMLVVGGVAGALGITLAIVGKGKENSLDALPCAGLGNCPESEVNTLKLEYYGAAVAGGVGALAIGVGLWQLFARPSAPAPVAFGPGGLRVAF